MDDYILRKTAKKAMCNMCEGGAKLVCGTLNDCCTTMRIFDSIPAADVRPVVKATWIIKEMQALFPGMDEHPVFMCSECGYQIYDLFDNLKEHHNFCPNCGADMREES